MVIVRFRRLLGIARITGLMCVITTLVLASNHSPSPEAVLPLSPYLGQQTTITATLNGVSGIFLFDTGEGLSTITPTFAQKIGCKPWGQVSGFRMSGERVDMPRCDNVRALAGHTEMTLPVVGVLDLMKFLGPDVPLIDGAIGLDAFAGKQITIMPRKSLVIESPQSFERRVQEAKELPVRLVRDAEGLALSVDGAVSTPSGMAWMELDTGNGGSLVIGNHIAPLMGLADDVGEPTPVRFKLANGVIVEGKARTRDLIMDGNIGAQFLNHWVLCFDLGKGRAWFIPI